MAGYNIRASIFRQNNDLDDVVGGAMITGTLVYQDVISRMQGNKPVQALLQQGLETERTFTALVIPGTLDIRERDEYEVTEPFDHVYHGMRFRVVGVLYSDHNPRDPRNYLLLSLVRSVRSHSTQ
jgi:hypothetical protein